MTNNMPDKVYIGYNLAGLEIWSVNPDIPDWHEYIRFDKHTDAVVKLNAATQRIETMTATYNRLGEINAKQAITIRELEMELREKSK